jgi:hypothetical protein
VTEFQLSADTRSTAGVLLLAIVAIESGGLFMLRIVRGQDRTTPFQSAFFRAGHAHAGVLVTLSLVALVVADLGQTSGPLASTARGAIPLAAILMPAGFFFSAMGARRTEPSRWILLLYAGALSLAIGTFALGLALLTASAT